MRTAIAIAALFLAGCTSTGEPRVGAILGGAIVGALLIAGSGDDANADECNVTTRDRNGTATTWC